MTSSSENQQNVIDLLTEQNQLLKTQNQAIQQALNILIEEKKSRQKTEIIKIIGFLIPYLIVIIIGFYLFNLISEYLNLLNQNINLLKDGFINITSQFEKFIPDFGNIQQGLNNAWQSATNLFNN